MAIQNVCSSILMLHNINEQKLHSNCLLTAFSASPGPLRTQKNAN